MNSAQTLSIAEIAELIQPLGLIVRGCLPTNNVAHLPSKATVLIGSSGSSAWPSFQASAEYQDGESDPLDRWSMRIANQIADQIDASVAFPFEGPPYLPFLTWATQVEPLQPSKLAIHIHPDYGLWHAYRFALLLNYMPWDMPIASSRRENLCDNCEQSPCLTACPVDAFSYDEQSEVAHIYDLALCITYLKANPTAPCHQQGCLARNACPVATKFRYVAEMQQFHMRAFVANH